MRHMILTIALGAVFFTLSFYLQVKVEDETSPVLVDQPINSDSPPCVQMFYSIEKYAEEYNIPKNFAYGVAFKETRYEGPFDWDYNPSQTSSAGALGPMQVMFSTAKMVFPKETFTHESLKTDIDFNVRCSMKLLRILYDKHKDWKIVFGAYNTGKPLVNQYAMDVYSYKR
jgi:soluble lytic murein transglycosylase-like protein